MPAISSNLERRARSERIVNTNYINGLSMEELFAFDSDGSEDIESDNHISNRFSSEEVQNFIDAEAEKKNHIAVEAMRNTRDFLMENGLSENPWSASSLKYIADQENLKLEFISNLSADLFSQEGDVHMRDCYENTLYNSLNSIKKDPSGLLTVFKRSKVPVHLGMGMEGMGVTATYQNEDHFSGLLGFAIANYFSRARSLELFYAVKNNEKPELTYRYILEYAIDPRTMEKLALPDAERDGRLEGAFDLMDALPVWKNENATPHIFKPSEVPSNEDGWVKTGMGGNLLSDTEGINKDENALEPNTRIDAVLYISDYEGDDKSKPKYSILPIQIKTGVGEGLSEERRFYESITIPNAAIINEDGEIEKNVTVTEYFSGYVNIDEGDYLVVTCNPNPNIESCVVGVKFYAKISDTANLRAGLQSTLQRYVYTLRTEYSNCGTIPINFYIRDNWGLGNNSIGWAASMTDALSKRFAITRDLKAERHLANDKIRPGNQFELYKKMGSFIANVDHDISEAGASGSGDLMTTSKRILKEKIIYNLIDCETDMNFSNDMERLWVLMGHESKIYAFEELNFTTEAYGNEEINNTVSNLKYGFDVESSAGYKDNFGRRVRILGSKDKRWVKKEIIGVLRSNTLASPTTVYFPYMFRIFTGIDARFTNLPSIQCHGRDLFVTLSKAQTNLRVMNLNADTQSNLMRSSKERYTQTVTKFPVPMSKK